VHSPSICRPAPGLSDTVEPCSQTPRLDVPRELLLGLRLQQLMYVRPESPQLIFELCRLRQLLRCEDGPGRLCEREARLQELVVQARHLLRGGLQPRAIEGAWTQEQIGQLLLGRPHLVPQGLYGRAIRYKRVMHQRFLGLREIEGARQAPKSQDIVVHPVVRLSPSWGYP
jgi:hypothetical protein